MFWLSSVRYRGLSLIRSQRHLRRGCIIDDILSIGRRLTTKDKNNVHGTCLRTAAIILEIVFARTRKEDQLIDGSNITSTFSHGLTAIGSRATIFQL